MLEPGEVKSMVNPVKPTPEFLAPGKAKSDRELFCSLKNGKGHMPLERIRITPSEPWNLVNNVQSLSK